MDHVVFASVSRNSGLSFCFALGALLAIGCGSSDGTVPVEGTVQTAAGAPLVGSSLIFYGPAGKTYTAGSDATGKFSVKASAESVGLPPGSYKVVVQEAISDDIDSRPQPKIHRKYKSEGETPLTVDVSAEPATIELKLDPPGK
ncbi:MAG: carboxypeptidase regulatory-like domain-containing protein [Planctomycetales bacterium]|nr:carboxypeptidase regulatory-like domain-containing protein [Planctomycetales bacterium]